MKDSEIQFVVEFEKQQIELILVSKRPFYVTRLKLLIWMLWQHEILLNIHLIYLMIKADICTLL